MITLPDLKNYLRYEDADTSQDSALGTILSGAQRWVENYTGHIMTQRTVSQSSSVLGDYLDLRFRPYVTDSLVITTLDSDYTVDDSFDAFVVFEVNGIVRVKPTGAWPVSTGGFTFTYLAGYEDAYDIPEDLMLAICLLVGMTDEQRGDQSSQGWKALYAMLEQYRMPVLA